MKMFKCFLLFQVIMLFGSLLNLQAQGTLTRSQYTTVDDPDPPPSCIDGGGTFCGTLYRWRDQFVLTPSMPYVSINNFSVHVNAPAGQIATVHNLQVNIVDPVVETNPGNFNPTQINLPELVEPSSYSASNRVYIFVEYAIELCDGSEPLSFGDFEFTVSIDGVEYSHDPTAPSGEGGEEELSPMYFQIPFSISTSFNIGILEDECEGDYELVPFEGPSKDRSFQPQELEINLFPNPSTSSTILNLEVQKDGFFKVDILNIQGQGIMNPVKEQYLRAGNHTFKLDFDDLSPGLYLIRIENQGVFYSEKFIKN